MPTETRRIVKRKRVSLPGGGTVDIPVIAQITFLDVVDQAQESEFHLENGSAGKRDVRIASIPGDGGATDETGSGSGLRVERVDLWRVLDVVEQGQETDFHPDSKTVNSSGPKYFSTHEKTHVVKYINTPDDGNWIKSELIDTWKFADTVDQGQESEYFLFNPPDNGGIAGLALGTDSDGTTTIAVDPAIAEIADAVDPVRTDPFQNIVDYKGAEPIVVTWYYKRDNDLNNPPDVAPVRPVQFKDLSLSQVPGSPTMPSDFTVTGTPTMPNIIAGAQFINWINAPAGGPPDQQFGGTTAVSGTVQIGVGPAPGVTTSMTSISASLSGVSGSKNGTPWALYGLSITFAHCDGPVTSPPLTVFGTVYPDWVIASAVFKPK